MGQKSVYVVLSKTDIGLCSDDLNTLEDCYDYIADAIVNDITLDKEYHTEGKCGECSRSIVRYKTTRINPRDYVIVNLTSRKVKEMPKRAVSDMQKYIEQALHDQAIDATKRSYESMQRRLNDKEKELQGYNF